MASALTSVLLCLALAISTVKPCAGLYEDEVGQIEWRFQNLGRTSAAALGPKRRLHVASDAGVLALLDLRSGDLRWRQVTDCVRVEN